MFKNLITQLFGTKSSRRLKKLSRTVKEINSLESNYEKLQDHELQAKTFEFRARISSGESLDSILVEAFAVVREATKRVTKKRLFDVQLYGGIILHQGSISEMKTGEGKTLVATLPSYLNALANQVHVVTANEYLAKRDCENIGQIHKFLGLTTSYISSSILSDAKHEAYSCDIVYGTASEFGFDYLRDNLKEDLSEVFCKKTRTFALIDEIDNILIDEARTPLIISGPMDLSIDGQQISSKEYMNMVNSFVKNLKNEHYTVDIKERTALLTDLGISFLEESFIKSNIIKENESIYDSQNKHLQHCINQLLKAYHIFKRDVDYVVEYDQIIIIDEFTGRKMLGRRYSDGMHQAIEAKENVEIQEESQTLASITIQNYFRLYVKISGMTGTAITEEKEFYEVYGLSVVEIPTNKKMIRQDKNDQVYRTFNEKTQALLNLVRERHAKGQPILIGTLNVEKSEVFSHLLQVNNIPHKILNAKNHEKEAEIISNAGMPGAITIATNMAGRGTDIQLGGNAETILSERVGFRTLSQNELNELKTSIEQEIAENRKKVIDNGGLLVIGTERNESRRIDNQLRGRAGRQGDKGESIFFLSLEDDLMRMCGSERLENMLQKLGMQYGEVITHPMVSRSIQKAQERIEMRNYSHRKSVLRYDDVRDFERRTIYSLRDRIISRGNLIEDVSNIIKSAFDKIIEIHISNDVSLNVIDLTPLIKKIEDICPNAINFHQINLNNMTKDSFSAYVKNVANQKLKDLEQQVNNYEILSKMYKNVLLRNIDQSWRRHLLATDHIMSGIHFRAYGQKDPVIEYKNESFTLFQQMLDDFDIQSTKDIFHRLTGYIEFSAENSAFEIEQNNMPTPEQFMDLLKKMNIDFSKFKDIKENEFQNPELTIKSMSMNSEIDKFTLEEIKSAFQSDFDENFDQIDDLVEQNEDNKIEDMKNKLDNIRTLSNNIKKNSMNFKENVEKNSTGKNQTNDIHSDGLDATDHNPIYSKEITRKSYEQHKDGAGRFGDAPRERRPAARFGTSTGAGRFGDSPRERRPAARFGTSTGAGRFGDSPRERRTPDGAARFGTSTGAGRFGDAPRERRTPDGAARFGTSTGAGRFGDSPRERRTPDGAARFGTSTGAGRFGDAPRERRPATGAARFGTSTGAGRFGDSPRERRTPDGAGRFGTSTGAGRFGDAPRERRPATPAGRSFDKRKTFNKNSMSKDFDKKK
ncbi:preprotein translocase subunit SecA [Candidatus Gromoviella agglomerans]|uniref:preprotein translocase subunit SecA n=1 Tax=Candidatus Gromoviella agglomerans TaxID=2806609 RepID=UPI001E5198E9|nr:preprotein translocase subunit SecA [Candidatus Gromoviella agglomerans]